MAAQAEFIHSADMVDYTAVGTEVGGEIVQAPDYRAGVVSGLGIRSSTGTSGATAGDKLKVYVKGIFDVTCATGQTFNAGQNVDWDNTNNTAVADGAGDFALGTCVKSKTTETKVRIDLNGQAYTA
jgi:predicted RecA/RadA family phage recombinase